MSKLDRRGFLTGTAALAAGLASGNAVTPQLRAATTDSVAQFRRPNLRGRSAPDAMPPPTYLNGRVSVSKPVLGPSQLAFRIGLARARTSAYPLDSLDFIMLDLERPTGATRHAHWCTGDLTGRLLEFLSCAQGVDGRNDPRLGTLFGRILKQRRPSGLFSRYHDLNETPSEEHFRAGSGRLFAGLVRYHELTGDPKALEAAQGLAIRLWSRRDEWRNHLKATQSRAIECWVGEPFARLYAVDRDARWLEFCGMIRDALGSCEVSCHSHGYLSTLRGMQTAALITGDPSWNVKPEANRRLIIERRYELPGGDIAENFPRSSRNEGCSIADWLMVNLNAALLAEASDPIYDRAERIFWNALAFNQWVTGGFGHRQLLAQGYGYPLEEAWWCCVHHAGMGMSELARHVVTRCNATLRINFLFPGHFEVPWTDGRLVRVDIATGYPRKAEATIEITGLPAASGPAPVQVRIPAWVARAQVSESWQGSRLALRFTGRMGHRLEPATPGGGVCLTYGPLILVPASYGFGGARLSEPDRQAPAGYVPESLPGGAPTLAIRARPDADGFLNLDPDRLPEWSYWDEGPQSRTSIPGACATVPVRWADGSVATLRFTPMAYNTSCLALFETPVVFREG